MIVFILCAALLTAIAVGLVAIPLVRPLRTQMAAAPYAAIFACVVLAGGSTGLYLRWSNWSWQRHPGIESPQSPIEVLVHHLDDHPRDLDDWLKLGRSYDILQEYPLAVRAFEQADKAADGRSAPALVGEAEAMIMIRDSSLDGRAGRLIERALVLAPNSPKALFFGAATALRQGKLTLARSRFSKLLAMNPPANVKVVLKREIAGIDSKLAGNVAATAPKKN